MTVLAIFLAVLGAVGWTTIEQRVHEKAEKYLKELDPVIRKSVAEAIRQKTNEIMYEGVAPVEEAVDAEVEVKGSEEK